MDLYLDDDAFVRAPPALVYRYLVDLSGYPRWWPGCRVERAAPAGPTWDAEAFEQGPGRRGEFVGGPKEPGQAWADLRLEIPRLGRTFRRPTRALRLHVRPYRFRPGKGLYLAFGGDLEGAVEWWLEPGWDGTVVHHLARADARHRHAPDAYRLALRRGLWGLKDAAQGEVRTLAGLPA